MKKGLSLITCSWAVSLLAVVPDLDGLVGIPAKCTWPGPEGTSTQFALKSSIMWMRFRRHRQVGVDGRGEGMHQVRPLVVIDPQRRCRICRRSAAPPGFPRRRSAARDRRAHVRLRPSTSSVFGPAHDVDGIAAAALRLAADRAIAALVGHAACCDSSRNLTAPQWQEPSSFMISSLRGRSLRARSEFDAESGGSRGPSFRSWRCAVRRLHRSRCTCVPPQGWLSTPAFSPMHDQADAAGAARRAHVLRLDDAGIGVELGLGDPVRGRSGWLALMISIMPRGDVFLRAAGFGNVEVDAAFVRADAAPVIG